MGKPFRKELEEIPQTYNWSREVEIKPIVSTIKRSSHLPLLSIGSGGSFSAAELQVTLHRKIFKSIGMACTPMELPSLFPIDGRASIWLMSASGNNIDIRRSFKHAILLEPRSISALVGCKGSKLEELAGNFEYVNLFENELPSGKDGFLATNSLFGFSTIMYRAYCEAAQKNRKLPDTIADLFKKCVLGANKIKPLEKHTCNLWKKDVLHIVYSPNLKCIAIDIESKFVEAGLGSVLLADLRNFAHGRHHWYSKNETNSSILCLTYDEDKDLGDRTLFLLPNKIPKKHITFKDNCGEELLAGLLLSFYFTYWAGLERNIDPGKPGVPEYGSKIYRLTAKSGFLSSIPKKYAAIRRKVAHGPDDCTDRKKWENAYNEFTRKLSKQKIGALILDYDGTIIDSREKGYPPSLKICDELVRLLDLGVKIGFATGRGKSIRFELQEKNAIPKKYWDRILIGYYNGSEIGELGDYHQPNGEDKCVEELLGIEKLLKENLLIQSLSPKITKRLHQITVEHNTPMPETFLWDTVQDQLKREAGIQARVVRSSHSIDIIAHYVTKLSVVNKMLTLIQKDEIVLTIGDRGRWPGNDSDLLGWPFSLSVDEVSSAEDSCWNLCLAGVRGPQGALYYLEKIQLYEGKILFK